MTTAAFNTRKIEMVQYVLNLTDPSILEALEQTINTYKANEAAPCTYTEQEVKARLLETESAAIAGEGISMDEVVRMSERWTA